MCWKEAPVARVGRDGLVGVRFETCASSSSGETCRSRRKGKRGGGISIALLFAFATILLPLGQHAVAQASPRACSEAFAAWVKQSEETLKSHSKRVAEVGAPAREACVPSHEARKTLTKSLDSVRRRCEAAGSDSDDVAITKPILEINADMIASIPICVERTAQIGKAPIGVQAPPPPSCLSLSFDEGIYWLSNVHCTGQKVIAVVEIKLSSGVLKCRGHIVTKSAKLGTSKPNLNYECVQNADDCSVARVKTIFPYCAW